MSSQASVSFEMLKTEIKMIEDSLVPLIMKKLKKGDKLWANKSILCKQSSYGKDLLNMERMIELCLVNFEKVQVETENDPLEERKVALPLNEPVIENNPL